MTHVVLVGMMGSGKSALGSLVATGLGIDHCDLDAMIAEHFDKTITEIFADEGEPVFREAESEVLRSVLDRSVDVVISTGGGVVLSDANRALLHKAVVVWLKARPETLVERIQDPASRPLLADDPIGAMRRLDEERRPLYAGLADVIVDVDGRTKQENAAEVLAGLRNIAMDPAPGGRAGEGTFADRSNGADL